MTRNSESADVKVHAADSRRSKLRRVLVLGGTGAIGAHAVRACLARGWAVRVLVRPTSELANLAGLDVELREGDLLRPRSVERALAGCDAFVHAAGFYPSAPLPPERAAAAGLASVHPVFDAARRAGVRRGVYVSSPSTIPPGRAAEGREEGAWEAGGPYGAAKAAMERAALEAAGAGLPLVIVNPTLCLGELDRRPTSGRIVIEVARGRVPVYLEGPVNVVYTADVGLGVARALERGRPGERYVLGGTNTTFGWLLRQIAFEVGARPPRFALHLSAARAGARLADLVDRLRKRPAMAAIAVELAAGSQHFDTSKAARELGLTNPTPAVETIRRAVSWFREAGMLVSRVRSPLSIEAPPAPGSQGARREQLRT